MNSKKIDDDDELELKKPKSIKTNLLISILVFYAIVILISTGLGYYEGKKNNMMILSVTAGFCLSSVFCIILWITAGQKMTNFCINS